MQLTVCFVIAILRKPAQLIYVLQTNAREALCFLAAKMCDSQRMRMVYAGTDNTGISPAGAVTHDPLLQHGNVNLRIYLLHEVIIDAHVAHRSAEGSGGCTKGGAENRCEEQNADQQTPECSGNRTVCGEMVNLIEFDLAFCISGHDNRIFEIDQIFALQ